MKESARGKILVVSPARNEEEHLPATIASMAAQTRRPDTWIVVDDGSTDATPQILERAMAELPFLRAVRRADRGVRSVGPGVIEAFYAGLETVDLGDYEYVVKLDSDLELPPRYFELVVARMEADPLLGNFSGKVWFREADGRLIPERMGDENAIGAAKFYRTECFRAIGGFVREVSWDGLDGHMCRMKGWIAASEDHPDLRIVHRRLMGSSHQSVWTGRKRWGRGKWFMGSAPYYIAAVAAYRMFEKPWIVGGVGIFWGYFLAALTGRKRFPDRAVRRQLRRHERLSLILGKRRATAKLNEEIRRAKGW